MKEYNLKLKELVSNLISLQKEGDYWDFKQEWHENMGDLVKDIICFCNTIHDKDCYIIFGISDDFRVIGMKKNRRKQADILDTLSNLKFSGSVKPNIEINTIEYCGKELDILTIKNIEKTPIYLEKNYGNMQKGIIYSRNKDRNTSNDNNSDIVNIENLWKKRFGILNLGGNFILDNVILYNDWIENENGYYHKYKTEYTLKIDYDELLNKCSPYYFSYVMTDERTHCYTLSFCQGGTELKSFRLLTLDGGRLSIPFPNLEKIVVDNLRREVIHYNYYIIDSVLDKLSKFLYEKNENPDKVSAYRNFKEVILFFKSEEEKIDFEKYVIDKTQLFEKRISEIKHFDYLIAATKEQTENYKRLLTQAVELKKLLGEYRKEDNH